MNRLLTTLLLLISLPSLAQLNRINSNAQKPNFPGERTLYVDSSGRIKYRPFSGPVGFIKVDSSAVDGWTSKFNQVRTQSNSLYKPLSYTPTVAGVLQLPDSLAAHNARLNGQDQQLVLRTTSKSLSALRAQNLPTALAPLSVFLTDKGKEGIFYLDLADTTTPDNTGTVIVDASNRRYKRPIIGPLNASQFGAVPDDGLDDYAAIQAAIDATRTSLGNYAGEVLLSAGAFHLSQKLNLTNTREAGTLSRDGIRLRGAGMNHTYLIGRTGAGEAVIDITGSQFLQLADFQVRTNSADAGRSTIGIYSGIYNVLPQTQNQTYRNIGIFMHSDTTANSNNGTVAFYNFGAEENTHISTYYRADRPLVITAYRTNPYTYTHALHTQPDAHSVGVTTFTGECFFSAITGYRPAWHLIDVNSISGQNLYFIQEAVGTQEQAIRINGAGTNLNLRGTIEGFPGPLHLFGGFISSSADFTMGHSNVTNGIMIRMEPGDEGYMVNSTTNLWLNNSTGRQLWGLFTTPSVAVPNYIAHSTIKANLPLAQMMMPGQIMWNKNTDDVILAPSAGRAYRINRNQHSIYAAEKTIRGASGSPTSGTIVTVQLPTVIANYSACAIDVEVEGIATHAEAGSNSPTLLRFKSRLPILINQLGVPTIGTAVNLLMGQTDLNAGGNSLSSVTLSGAVSGNTVIISATPTVSGANNEAVKLNANVTMTYQGNLSSAPYLLP